MKLLLDTHALLWFLEDNPALAAEAIAALSAPRSEVRISFVSLWELAVKASIGKLRLSAEALGLYDEEGEWAPLALLPLTRAHALAVSRLPLHHRDPFDRLLVAQALEDGFTLVTHDRRLAPYGVPILWT